MSRRTTLAAVAAAICTATATATATDAVAARNFGSRPLYKPMRGDDVRVLQQLLTDWGLPIAVDGQFGPHTKLRVRSWERNSGRRINGRVSRAEAAALQAAVAAGERLPGLEPEPEAQAAPVAPAETATIGPDGLAIAPASAPEAVKAIIAAGNEIHAMPYEYGGGHAGWADSGYDCSGSMSYALHGAGLLSQALDSTGFMGWGEAGTGQWVTIYANAGHSYMIVAGLRFDTSARADAGSRWHADMRSASGYTVRRPTGL